ncbi:MAG: DnaA N-terminal domain-containing protein [Pseudomonadota bacterium]
MIGLHRGGATHPTVLRLIAAVTARYNWRLDELSMCQRDMARMWGVSERTAKRDVKAWIAERWVLQKRTGVRGRAGAYRLDLVEISRQAAPLWALIGPDFAERMAPVPITENVIRPVFGTVEDTEPADARGTWRAVSRRLRDVDAAMHGAWIAPLVVAEQGEGCLTLRAPSRFAAHYISTHLMGPLQEAATAELGPTIRLQVIAG